MTPAPTLSDGDLDAGQVAEFAAIRRLLELSSGAFSFSSVICNDVALERALIQGLVRDRAGVIHLALSVETSDAFDFAMDRVGSGTPSGLLLSGFADWLGNENTSPQRIRALNASRELWQRFTCPILFWMNSTVASRLAYEAQDLWRYRSHRFDLAPTAPAPVSRGVPVAEYLDGGDSLSLSRDRKIERIAELRQRIAQITEASPLQVRQHALQWMLELGNIQAVLGNMSEAATQYEQALALAREIGERRGESSALGNLGNAYWALGDARKAIEFCGQGLVIAREVGDRRGEGAVLVNLGNAYAALSDARKAIEFYEQALKIAREIGDRLGEGSALGNLGLAHAALGDARKAIEFHEQHLKIAREIGDRRGEGQALGNLGLAHAALGEARKARECHEQALVIDRDIGDRRGEGQDLGNLGNAYFALGDARKAIECQEQALIIDREIGDRRGEGQDLGNLGNAYFALGDARKAIECQEQALIIDREIGDRRGEGTDLWNRALALDKLGRRAEAIADARAALAIFEQIEAPSAEKVRRRLAEWTPGPAQQD